MSNEDGPIVITYYGPGQRPKDKRRAPRHIALNDGLPDLLKFFSDFERTCEDKSDNGYVVVARVNGTGRSDADCTGEYLLQVDYEPPGLSPSVWNAEAWPAPYVAFTSGSHCRVTKQNPEGGERWKVFLAVELMPTNKAERDAACAAIERLCPAGSDIRVVSQPAYMPTLLPDGPPVEYLSCLEGRPLDWRALTAGAPLVAPPEPAESTGRLVDPESAPDAELWGQLLDAIDALWPANNRHYLSMALAGVLYGSPWPDEDCREFQEAVLNLTGSDETDGMLCFEDTWSRRETGECTKGVPSFKALLAYGREFADDDARRAHHRTLPADPDLEAPVGALTQQSAAERFARAGVVANTIRGVHAIVETTAESVTLSPDEVLARAYEITVIQADGQPETDTRDGWLSSWGARTLSTDKGLINSTYNVVTTLRTHPNWTNLFAFDEFTQKVVFMRVPDRKETNIVAREGEAFNLGDHITGLRMWFTKKGMSEPQRDMLAAAVTVVAKDHKRHAVRDWLASLAPWDGVERNLSTYVGAKDNAYHRAVCSKWMISAVARAITPGCQVDTMLILESPGQGLRKSSLLYALCPYSSWALEANSDEAGTKDFFQGMRGRWIGELSEADHLISGRHASSTKAFMSKRFDSYRKSYGYETEDFPRQMVFFGTTNQSDYFQDETGNRRFWCVLCSAPDIDMAGLRRDRDQLWAQALHAYAEGMKLVPGLDDPRDAFIWWLTPEENALAVVEQADRMETDDVWEDGASAWLATQVDKADGTLRVRVQDVLGNLPGARPIADITPADIRRMRKVLRRLGMLTKAIHGQRWWTADRVAAARITARGSDSE